MKTLSIKQPWAELIISGKKTIELRSWNTKHRGEFLIHASLTHNKEAMKRFGYTTFPTGAIIGKVTLKDVKHYEDEADCERDKDKHLAGDGYTKCGFVLENPERLEPIAAKGKLGFWDFDF